MQQEQGRLEVLRQLTYEEYLQSPEWQEKRTTALGWFGHCCQGCKASGVSLEVYHRHLENVGCEQKEDLMVLCEVCFDRLAQHLVILEEGGGSQRPGSSPHFSFGKRVAVFVPSALVGLALPALLHAPLPAEVGGLVVAFALAAMSPKIYAELRYTLPAPLVEIIDGMLERKRERAARGEWSTVDRLLGRHLKEQETLSHESEEPFEGESFDALQDYLDLGPTLRPHADRLLSGRKVILGISGSGKTNTTNVYCEELGKLDPAPALILFDTDDENRALCDKKYFPNPQWLEKSRRLTANNAYQAAQTIMERRYQCVVNLQSYEEEEAAWIMINMLQGVRAWQEAHTVRIPCEIILDEASVWLPQNTRESLLSSVMVDDPDGDGSGEGRKVSLLALLQRAFFTVVRRGRRRGMGLTLAAQRIAELDKRALQGSWMFLMRQTQPADWREYQKYGISSQDAMALLDGEAYVIEPDKPMSKHRLRQSACPHSGITPGMKALRTAKSGPKGAGQSPELNTLPQPAAFPTPISKTESRQGADLQTTLSAFAQVQGMDERMVQTLVEALPALKTQLISQTPLSGELPKSDQRAPGGWHTSSRMNAPLQVAYDTYQPGMNHHTLAQRLVTTPRIAGQLLRQLVGRGYIDGATGIKLLEQVEAAPAKPRENLEAYSQAVAMWNSLSADRRNVRDFAVAIGLGETKAWQLLSKMEQLGLIQWERRKKKGAG
jgi:hypothetical protein